jgi:hypothetical protein
MTHAHGLTQPAASGWLHALVSRFLHVLHEASRQAITEVLHMKQLRDIRKHMNMLLELTRRHQKQEHQIDWLTVKGIELNSLSGSPDYRYHFRYKCRGRMGNADTKSDTRAH